MADNKHYSHWKPLTDAEGILWLHLDQQNSSTNVLCVPVLEELETILVEIKSSHLPSGVVFVSDKESGFIAGADIKEFTVIDNVDQAVKHVQRGQRIMDEIAALKCPTVAMIHGYCMGGGFELALACDYRIVDDGPTTRLSLPEVQLGIHPGFGGTVRLPRLIGAPAAMDIMLTGKPINARKAKKLGMVDYAVPTRQLIPATKKTIMDHPPLHQPTKMQALTNHMLIRPILKQMILKTVAKKARKDHYPAPYAIIDLWAKYFDDPVKMLEEEAKSEARLVIGPTAQNLIRVFFLRETLKALGKTENTNTNFKHVHVIGAGVMGGDIAAWCALRGFQVTLQDRHEKNIAKVMKRAHKLFSKKMRGNRLGIIDAMDRLQPDIKGLGVPKADVVIEAIVENIEAKQGLYKELESRMKSDALLTTNTSSIPLEVLSTVLKNPERLVGLHFFNPVAQMPLIEIVTANNTSKEVAERTAAFATQIDRLPLPVKSGPGFLVNRILMPYMLEAVRIHEEGVPASVIDKIALQFGMPMGPLALADTVGLDICLSVAGILSKELDVTVPESLKKMVEEGKLGAKSGSGFYEYSEGKQVKPEKTESNVDSHSLQDRMIGRMINESVACLRESVVANKDQLDAGVIFGTGFSPFRGGPLNYAQSEGYQSYQTRLSEMEKNHGTGFKPDSGWEKLA
ncbi:MAG: 3-hydroxyacyl-CoA dehydrogenase NAD-binding domain-containing protein [Gammaproteobacteria bacterium]|nr:3-hydroxyacyl-CoA dehydrogenase NAD-binding domain-containing protein [Gammaproteobacteria bacterium]